MSTNGVLLNITDPSADDQSVTMSTMYTPSVHRSTQTLLDVNGFDMSEERSKTESCMDDGGPCKVVRTQQQSRLPMPRKKPPRTVFALDYAPRQGWPVGSNDLYLQLHDSLVRLAHLVHVMALESAMDQSLHFRL